MRRLGSLLVLLAILIEYCVAQPQAQPWTVNVAFNTTEIYTEALKNHSSAEYKALAKKIRDEVLASIPKSLDCTVQFFINGSGIVDGKADSVIVHARVIIDKKFQNQKRADNFVRNKLKKAGFTDVSVGVRLCVDGSQLNRACIAMKEDRPWLKIICVEARDRYECIQWLNDEKVDVVGGEAADIYLANELFGDNLKVVANTRDKEKKKDTYENRIVAVVRKSIITNGLNSLEGSKFCSTGYGTTSGWFLPLSKLKGKLDCSHSGSVLEQNLHAIDSYFGESCLPGQWGPIEDISNYLKRDVYPDLCKLYDSPIKCMAPAGPDGALQCLNSGGDVAWIDFESFDISSFLNPGEFGFLCLDGSVVDLHSENPCIWAGKPWPGWLIRANVSNEEDFKSILPALRRATKPSVIKKLETPSSPYNYLNEGIPDGYYITINEPGCEGVPVKFCVTSDIALQKCTELAQVLKSRRVRPLLTCVKEENCTSAIGNGIADFVPLDGGDVFTGYRDQDLIPVISEVYGEHNESYYAVAVVRADSEINTFADLKGKNSCHTGINKTAGWNMPLSALLDAELLNEKDCDYPRQIGDFFKESCVPGANSSKYDDPAGTNPASLCELCIGNGDGNFVCERKANELYYGYTGAFRCLVKGGGDVAFVKHTTVPSNTGDDCKHDWCKDLNSSDYRLLCKDGTSNVDDYLNCNLAKVPSHMVVTRNNTDDNVQEDIRNLLLLASELLPRDNAVFALFGDYGIYHDVLFKNSATNLINLSEDEFEELKEDTYWKALEKLEDCHE